MLQNVNVLESRLNREQEMATEIKHDWWILSGIVSADVLAGEHLWYCYHILALARTDPGSPGLAGVPGVS